MSYPRIGRGVKRGKRRPTSGGKKRDPRSTSRKEISSVKNQLSKQIKQSGNRPSRRSTSRKERSSLENKLSKQIKQARKDSRRSITRRRPKMFGGPRRVRRVRRRR